VFETYSLQFKNQTLECSETLVTTYESSGDVFKQPLSNKTRYYMPTIQGLRDFRLTLIVRGNSFIDYENNKNELLNILNEGTTGTLIHPFFGEIFVACVRNTISVNESFEELGLCKIEVQFYEITPTSKISNQAQPITISSNELKTLLVEDIKNQLESIIENATQLQNTTQKMSRVKNLFNTVLDIQETARQNILKTAGYANQVFGHFQGVLAMPSLYRTSVNTVNNLRNRYTSILNLFKNPERLDNNNPVITVALIDNTIDFLETNKDIPQNQQNSNTNPITNVLNLESSTEELTLALLKESQEIYQNSIESDNQQREQELLAFGENSSVVTLDNPLDVNDNNIIRSLRLYIESLYVYNFLLLLIELRNFEFDTTDQALDFIRIINENILLITNNKEIQSSTTTNIRKFAIVTKQFITSQLRDLEQLQEVETKNLPLRVVLYRYTNSTNSLYSTYQSNPVFDIGVTPDKLTIIKPNT